ncbi:MAG TPA: hypothetical protein VGC13_05470 [Longimicrobium sp.]|jgi:hypothetical protein|uniref:hypothetical protein n=1 Tax=Longimicrobium sp. TaxID=2029185 RepID=UPI002ED9D019
MKKLKLDPDALAVESFDAESGAERPRGTVRARSEETDFLCGTNFHSCGWSEIDCHTQECRTDWVTCGGNGSCCPAVCW